MQNVAVAMSDRKMPAHISAKPRCANQPPFMLPNLEPADVGKYPASIFGKLPAGFVLKDQSIYILAHWHRRAMRAVDDVPAGSDVEDAMSIANELFRTIKGVEAKSPGMVSVQMTAIAERLRFMKNNNALEEELDVTDFLSLAEALANATALPKVTKRVGPLKRGRKLTRAGLLHRYHAFLIGEIQTLSLNLYGSREYAMRMQPIDDAVTVRVKAGFKNGKFARRQRTHYPFFDEGKLPARARYVLKSLKIDTEIAAER